VNWVELANVVSAMAVSAALNSLWIGFLLVALAAGAIRLLPRPNATTRYAIWLTALMLALVTPALLLLPHQAPAAAMNRAATAPAPLTVPVTAQWPMYAVLVWLGITAVLMMRLCWSVAHIHGLKSRGTLIGERSGIRVLVSHEVAAPLAAGFVVRAVIFPQSVIDELSPHEFEQVLYHESAHLRRWDDWTQLMQALAQALLFFNPTIYWIGRRLKIEREMACDDWVVSATGEARPYAACLTHLHEVTRRVPAPQLAPGATSRKRWQLSARVEALLEPNRNATPRFSRSGWMAAGALATAALLVAARTAPPVGAGEIPLAQMTLASPGTPAAPAISLIRERAAPARARLVASQRRKPALPAEPVMSGASIVLVDGWQVDVSPRYVVITVFFSEPPPKTALGGI